MPEQLLTVLKLCLLALLYLFFLRVLRAVWTEVNPPKTAPAAEPVAGRERRVAPRSGPRGPAASRRRRRGSSWSNRRPVRRAEFALGPELTVGRAPGCSMVFDEQFVSQVHARMFVRDGGVFVEDLGSTNGTWVNGSRVVGQMPARPGDRIQVGNVVMEVR